MQWDYWYELAERLGLAPTVSAEMPEVFRLHYEEKHRAYHQLSHIGAMLDLWQAWPVGWQDADTVALAIWFHDLIYNPRKKNNEQQSARQAVAYLQSWGLSQARIQKVEKLILATAGHQARGLDEDGKGFLDLDLSILGSEPDLYDAYVKAIRKEYRMYPDLLYRPARKKILKRFLARDRLYFTGTGFSRWERMARENIRRELAQL